MQRTPSPGPLAAAAVIAALLLPLAAHAQSNTIPCGDAILNAPLPVIPEIRSVDGVLRGTLYTVSEQIKMTTTSAGPGSAPNCFPQWVRAYRPDAPSTWNPPSTQLLDPMPGPTLRARLGDIVTLTFLNSIDAAKFPNADAGCDTTSVYPGTTGDKAPDCFAGSVFTNVHYHGTHTNPSSTGDNVFLNVRPSPREQGAARQPIVTAAGVKEQFDAFFTQCIQELQPNPGPKIWPRLWSDLQPSLQTMLMDLVEKYGVEGWYASNQKLIAQGQWPQYYVGAYPYCFKLPEYVATTAASTASPEVRTPHTHGRGAAEVDEAAEPARPLRMGQSPGTHWYHAHKHGSTTINVMNGMTGVFVIEGATYDDAINAVYGANWTARQPVMVIQQLGSVPGLSVGKGLGPGPDFSVNGKLRPTVTMPGNSVQMWRIANTAGRAGAFFVPPAPKTLQWKQLAQDGVQFKPVNYEANHNHSFQLASGNRADLLVKAPPYVKGGKNIYPVYVYNTIDPSDRPPQKPAAAKLTLLTVVVTPNGPDMDFIPVEKFPEQPAFLTDITDEEVVGTKILKFASTAIPPGPPATASQHTIDGKKFDGELGVVVGLNRAEEWKVVNETFGPATNNQIAHPFHIHINPFQITELFDPNAILSSAPGAGTVTTTQGTGSVKGTDTTFDTVFRPGDMIWINGEAPATVLTVDGPDALTINIAAAGVAAASYTSAVPLYSIDAGTARPAQCVLDPKDPNSWKPCRPTEPPADRIWWDVFPIPSGNTFPASGGTTKIPGYFKMRSRFVDYAGYYVLHCHILAHEDRGMMTVVQVAPLQTPYSHH